MSLIPTEALPHFENAIYLPMILIILEKDRHVIEGSQLKFKKPYIQMLDQATKNVESDLKKSSIYLKRNNMKLIKGGSIGDFTEYQFIHLGVQDNRKYLNVRLRNRTEELMSIYFDKMEV